jgi:hypothetical protein
VCEKSIRKPALESVNALVELLAPSTALIGPLA